MICLLLLYKNEENDENKNIYIKKQSHGNIVTFTLSFNLFNKIATFFTDSVYYNLSFVLSVS